MTEAATESILAGEPIRIDYVPRDGLFKLAIVNFLLGIVTLSVYRFWAKTTLFRDWSALARTSPGLSPW